MPKEKFSIPGYDLPCHKGVPGTAQHRCSAKPTTEKKKKLKQKLSEYLKRNKAIARPLAVTIKRVNEIVRG